MRFEQSKAATKVAVLAALLLVAGAFAGATQAQTAYRGKFTLDHSVRWGKAEIPAGDYRFTLERFGPGRLIARVVNAKTNNNVALIPCTRATASQGDSVLILGHRGDHYVVHTLRLQELGESFVYDPELASEQTRQEAKQVEGVPILFAKN